MERAEVVVVGAGLAGLACALRLAGSGVPSLVLEAGGAPGGRVRTDVVGGFRCDRGFQLLNPSYPALRRVAELAALELRPFLAGAVVAARGGHHLLADPRRVPRGAWTSLVAPVGTLAEKAAFAAWALRAALADPHAVRDGADEPLSAALDRAGVRGGLRTAVVDPFLAGVLADGDGTTSASFARLVVRSFVRGTPAVPAAGVAALPEQLAAALVAAQTASGAGRLDLRRPVRSLRRTAGGVALGTDDGEVVARAVVVATAAPAAAALLPGLDAPASGGLTTFWHAAPEPPAPPRRARALHLGDGRGPVVNSALMTAVAPGYSDAPGRHLVASTVLGVPGAAATEPVVRRQLAGVWGTGTARWELVTAHELPHALPSLPAPLDARRPVALGDGVFVAGDHRDTASQQGALTSGRRAAGAVLAALGAPARD